MLPHYDTKDGWTWLETVRELGEDFFAGDRKSPWSWRFPSPQNRDRPLRPLRPAGRRANHRALGGRLILPIPFFLLTYNTQDGDFTLAALVAVPVRGRGGKGLFWTEGVRQWCRRKQR